MINCIDECFFIIKQRLMDNCTQELLGIVQQSPKCVIYRYLVDNFTLQYYLCKPMPQHFKKLITKIRLSSHCLSVESGRYHNIERKNRLCQFCLPPSIEDEYHFILVCLAYATIRKQLIKSYYWQKPSAFKLIQLLSVNNVKQLSNLGKFLFRAFKLRNNQNAII